MFRLLTFLGLGGLGYAFYNYYNKQLDLALDWNYKIKNVKVINITKQGAKLNLLVQVTNKSNFTLNVKDYDLKVIYKGVEVGNSQSIRPITIPSDSFFEAEVITNILFDSAKGLLDDVAIDIITGKPLLVDIKGELNVNYGKIDRKVVVNVKDISVSKNVASDLGISKPIDSVKDFLGGLGIGSNKI
tara:strand:+ start:218 stop:778 length:561 start_codon:yes stop_codon:yes gene_type:complete